MLLCLAITSAFSRKACCFPQEYNELKSPGHFRNPETNHSLINAVSQYNGPNIALDTDYTLTVMVSAPESYASPNISDFIEDARRELHSTNTSGIASCLYASGIGYIMLPLKDEQRNEINFKIHRVLNLKKLQNLLLSPQQVLQKHRSIGRSFTLNRKSSCVKLE